MSRNNLTTFPNSSSNNSRRNSRPDNEYWSEASGTPITWNQFRNSHAYNRYSVVEEERRHLRSLTTREAGNFLGTEQAHWIPERERRDFESSYRPTSHHIQHGTDTLHSISAIITTIQLYPEGFPNFEFIDPTTGETILSAYPSHRYYRLPRNTRIILQALEVAFRDPLSDYFEEE